MNDQKEITLVVDYSQDRGNTEVLIQLPGDITVNIFAGLETKSDAMFKVSHNFAGAEIDDLKIHLALVGGHQLQTEFVWRKETIRKLQSYLKWFTNYFQLSDASTIDYIKILELTESFLGEGIDNLFQRNIKIDYKLIQGDLTNVVHQVHSYLEGRQNINDELLTYITDSLQNIINNR